MACMGQKCPIIFCHTKLRIEIYQGSAHSGGTETKVKEIVSDIPPHTNQNIGIF